MGFVHRHDIMSAYFDSKAIQYQSTPSFELREAGPLRWLHGVPGWPEVDAFYAINLDPYEVVAAIRAVGPDKRHALTIFDGSIAPDFRLYADLGYIKVPGPPQPLLMFQLAPKNTLESCRTFENVQGLGLKIIVTRNDDDQRIARYQISTQEKTICQGSSIRTSNHIVYVYGLETDLAYRRRGLASAIMERIHYDSCAAGCTTVIMCASRDGLKLYNRLEYKPVLYMHMLTETKTSDDASLFSLGA
jgi:GNAT superfamily N-acetyltransferase